MDLTISDPFELSGVTVCQIVSLDTFADGAERERMLVLLETPLTWAGTSYDYAVLENRHASDLLDELEFGAVVVNGYGMVTPGSLPPWGVENWRGGLGFLATATARRRQQGV